MKFHSIQLVGAPGSGKTTLANKLIEKYQEKLVLFSLGNQLRGLGDELPEVIKEHMDKGLPIPTEPLLPILDQLIQKMINEGNFNPLTQTLLFESFRSMKQLEGFETISTIQKVVVLEPPNDDLLIQRIKKRNEGRTDDSSDIIIQTRIDFFKAFYKQLLEDHRYKNITSIIPIDELNVLQLTNVTSATLRDILNS